MPFKPKERISELLYSVLEDTDFFLVDLKIHGSRNPVISVYADGKHRNINMDECAEISNQLSFLMDAHELFNGVYRLNVSSPGLGRPLVDRRQYPKNIGRKVKVKARNDEGEFKVNGILEEVSEDKIMVNRKNDRLEISFDKITETKVVPSLK